MASLASVVSSHDVAQLRAETVPVAIELARLGAASQFLTQLRESQGQPGFDLLQSFAIARMAMQNMSAALQEDSPDEASERLDLVRTETARLRQLVAEADQDISLPATEAFLATHPPSIADLRRMIEYHALVAPRGDDSAAKLVSLAGLLLRRDEVLARQPRLIRDLLDRRKVLTGTSEVLEPELIAAAAALRRRIADSRERGIGGVQAAVVAFRSALGPALYSVGGLSQVLALEVALAERVTEIRREVARGFDALLEDLDGVGDVRDDQSQDRAAAIHGDEAALGTLLAEVEADFSAGATAADYESHGIFLEESERDRIENPHDGDSIASLLRSAAVHRTAMDRQARLHSKRPNAVGEEPEAIARPLVVSLVAAALAIEAELGEINQRAIQQSDIATAKLVTRCSHRLARTRLGVALLADVPPDGVHDQRSAGATFETTGVEAEVAEAALTGKLAQAKLFRAALRGERAPVDDVAASAGPARAAVAATVSTSSTSTFATKPPRLSRRHRRTLAGVAVLTLLFHGIRLAARDGGAEAALQPDDFLAPISLTAVNPLRGTLVARTDESWTGSAEGRRLRLGILWDQARSRDFESLILVEVTSGRPVAIADGSGLRLFDQLPDLTGGVQPTE